MPSEAGPGKPAGSARIRVDGATPGDETLGPVPEVLSASEKADRARVERTIPEPAFVRSRLVIEQVMPALDGGRYSVKRSVGEVFNVEAVIYKDGHDLVTARVLYRSPGDESWHQMPLEYRYDPDRWYASFPLDKPGLWQYTIQAWPDYYRTWSEDLRKRIVAGQDIGSELLEGMALLERAAARLSGDAKARVQHAARQVGDTSLRLDDRLATAFSRELADLIYGPLEPTDASRYEPVLEVSVDREVAVFGAWYELFPRSQTNDPGRHGTFMDVERRLPEIAALGFDVVYLPPIHPIGRVHRKGRNNAREAEPGAVGCPWAIGSVEGGHTAVHPELGTMADFERMVRSAHELGLEIALDYALQCAPDHPWSREHPEWFFVRPDGTLRYAENPPKKYEDIYPLNFWCADREGLWAACRDVLLFWIERGVRIFRVDNPHTKPFAFWAWVLREVQSRHPDVVFLSESFTRPNRMKGLAKLGFTQSYTYFTWKNDAAELTDYLTELTRGEMPEYFRPNFFANTPDILHEYLQHGGRPAFRVRLLLAATLAPSYGIYSGYELCENTPVHPGSEEYLDSEKYEIRVRDWNAPGNIKRDVARVNRLRREHPALRKLTNLEFLPTDNAQLLAYRKYAPESDLIIVVNLDPHHMQQGTVTLPLGELGLGSNDPFEVEDLLTGARYTWRGERNYVRLDPAEHVGHVLRVLR